MSLWLLAACCCGHEDKMMCRKLVAFFSDKAVSVFLGGWTDKQPGTLMTHLTTQAHLTMEIVKLESAQKDASGSARFAT